MAEYRRTDDETHLFILEHGATLEVRQPWHDASRRLWAVVVATSNGKPVHHTRIDLLDQRMIIDFVAVATKRDNRIDWEGAFLDCIPRIQEALTADAATPQGLALTALGDLLDEPEDQTDWLAEELLPSGGFSLVSAKPKVGKSTLARCLRWPSRGVNPSLDVPPRKAQLST